jgi:hypothetical protein
MRKTGKGTDHREVHEDTKFGKFFQSVHFRGEVVDMDKSR